MPFSETTHYVRRLLSGSHSDESFFRKDSIIVIIVFCVHIKLRIPVKKISRSCGASGCAILNPCVIKKSFLRDLSHVFVLFLHRYHLIHDLLKNSRNERSSVSIHVVHTR